MPPEVQRLTKTIERSFDKIANLHHARVSDGPTESLNNLIECIKLLGFGFRNLANYRIRALLYACRPNRRVLCSIVVR
jgi:transposase